MRPSGCCSCAGVICASSQGRCRVLAVRAGRPPRSLGRRPSGVTAAGGAGRGGRAAAGSVPAVWQDLQPGWRPLRAAADVALGAAMRRAPRERHHARSGNPTQPPLGRVPGQCRRDARPGRRPARAGRQGRGRRRRGRARQAHGARQAAAARPRADAARPGHALPGARAAGRARHVQRRRARRRRHRRHRPRQRRRLHDRLQRRHGEGRHLLPDDGEEAPARAGDRAAEPPALHLPGRLAAAPTCRTRTRCSPTATTSAASSTTRPT